MHPVLQKQADASLHILSLILACGKTEACTIATLSQALPHVLPNPTALNAGLLGESIRELKDLCIEKEKSCYNGPADTIQIPEPVLPTPEPPVAAPAKAPARRKATAPAAEPAAPPAAAPAAAPAPAPAPAAQPEEEAPEITQEAADRLRQLVRDTYTARTKKITADGDPNNSLKIEYTTKFTETVKDFGADTVTGTDNAKLQALLDAVRAL